MSLYAQTFRLRCVRCPQVVDGRRSYATPLAVGRVGRRVTCHCGRCGHRYESSSQAARREWYWVERARAAETGGPEPSPSW